MLEKFQLQGKPSGLFWGVFLLAVSAWAWFVSLLAFARALASIAIVVFWLGVSVEAMGHTCPDGGASGACPFSTQTIHPALTWTGNVDQVGFFCSPPRSYSSEAPLPSTWGGALAPNGYPCDFLGGADYCAARHFLSSDFPPAAIVGSSAGYACDFFSPAYFQEPDRFTTSLLYEARNIYPSSAFSGSGIFNGFTYTDYRFRRAGILPSTIVPVRYLKHGDYGVRTYVPARCRSWQGSTVENCFTPFSHYGLSGFPRASSSSDYRSAQHRASLGLLHGHVDRCGCYYGDRVLGLDRDRDVMSFTDLGGCDSDGDFWSCEDKCRPLHSSNLDGEICAIVVEIYIPAVSPLGGSVCDDAADARHYHGCLPKLSPPRTTYAKTVRVTVSPPKIRVRESVDVRVGVGISQ